MENLVLVKASDLDEIKDLITCLRNELQQLKENEEQKMAYGIQQTAEILDLHYNSVRNQIKQGKLFAKYLDGESGKCIVLFWAIKDYLKSEKKSNH